MTCRQFIPRVLVVRLLRKHEREAAHQLEMVVSASTTCPEECYEAFSVASAHERLGKLPPLKTSSTFGIGCVDVILHDVFCTAGAQLRRKVTAATQHRSPGIGCNAGKAF